MLTWPYSQPLNPPYRNHKESTGRPFVYRPSPLSQAAAAAVAISETELRDATKTNRQRKEND